MPTLSPILLERQWYEPIIEENSSSETVFEKNNADTIESKSKLCLEILKVQGFCIVQVAQNNDLKDCDLLKIYQSFLSHIGFPIKVFSRYDSLWRTISVDLNKAPDKSEGIGASPLHIDFVNSSCPPDIVGLLCLRSDPKGGGQTVIANYKQLLDKMPEKYFAELSKSKFRNGSFFDLANIGWNCDPFSVINPDFLRYTEKLKSEQANGIQREALEWLSSTLEHNRIEFTLEKNQLVLLDQHQVVHGKTSLGDQQQNLPLQERRQFLQIFIRTRMNNDLTHLEKLFSYLGNHYHQPDPDFMLVLGSSDLDVAKFAASYYNSNPVKHILISGGFGKITKDQWGESEASKFSKIMIANGVPNEIILLDEKATNTGENIINAKKLLDENKITGNVGLIITKPYMTRRAYNTACKQWASVRWACKSAEISFHEYFERQEFKERFANILAGDLQRIQVYGEKGFQITDIVPDTVLKSYDYLVSRGYTKFVIQ